MIRIGAVLAVSGLAASASATSLAQYSSSGAAMTPTSLLSGVVTQNFGLGAGVSQVTGAASTHFGVGGVDQGSLTAAQTSNDYVEFGVSVAQGMSLSVDHVSIYFGRQSAAGNRSSSIAVFASTSTDFSGAVELGQINNFNYQTETGYFSASLSSAFENVETVVFRIYYWQYSGIAGETFQLRNFGNSPSILISGEAGVAVPTPHAFGLCSLGLGVLVARRRR